MRGIKIGDKFTVLDICVHMGLLLFKVHRRVVGHAFQPLTDSSGAQTDRCVPLLMMSVFSRAQCVRIMLCLRPPAEERKSEKKINEKEGGQGWKTELIQVPAHRAMRGGVERRLEKEWARERERGTKGIENWIRKVTMCSGSVCRQLNLPQHKVLRINRAEQGHREKGDMRMKAKWVVEKVNEWREICFNKKEHKRVLNSQNVTS